MGLEIAPQHPQDAVDEYRRGEGPQHRDRILRHEHPCAEVQHQAGRAPYRQHIADGSQENPVGIAVLLYGQLLGNDLGHCGGDAVRGHHQNNRIIIIR